ncbi:hydrogenobyrinate a,c-diamide synthase [Sulfuriferula plumbiphila]|uniref:Hydrogenobyrinate a,c-diamide synthase n=1 Tax=Sulfuriferula plumbiphila TaxID=171865 RepID=A0A512LA02_9PROT|nr:cobyrinate a,c-diamide synthase [Sulfuriferula plumbiphila]BBP05229.1 hydrogenobyrinate a,c-diamide synthase [Sulfuriferula plumbiphila]GEP31282.1 hydrogenobyrinate a,c-diamide synthase [Sulfuriferula plumbiphila]
MQTRRCPALFISAPGSHHGKTTVTAALARFHADQGRKVRVFKTGPDFLDPMILERACGQPVYQLDLWLAGETACRRLVYEAAQEADLILVEGVMGLFDGTPSSADLAQLLGVPVLAVIDATGTAQTLGAIAYGLAHFRSELAFAGVLANAVASARHAEMMVQGMPPGMRYFGGLPRASQFTLPERHLGLVQAAEIVDLEARLAAIAASIASTALAALPAAVEFTCASAEPLPQLLAGTRIGIARDAAFSFIYPANLDVLRALGAELVFFSPLADQALPQVDSLYLPGGYPELHLQQLQDNAPMKAALHSHFRQGKPIYAECGGMLYLFESLTDKAGQRAAMTGLLPGHAVMQARRQGLGYQSAPMPGGVLRSHAFHHSVIDTPLVPVASGERLYNTSQGERIFRLARLTATYLHCYFPSNPSVAARLFLP